MLFDIDYVSISHQSHYVEHFLRRFHFCIHISMKSTISARIHARKILLVYFYEQYFLLQAGKNKQSTLSAIDKIQKIVANPSNDTEIDIDLTSILKWWYYDDFDAEIAYIIEYHFPKFSSEDIDFEYIKEIGPLFWEYEPQVCELVNQFATSFGYESMDLMDRVLFVLWYLEYKVLWADKGIVLNEMIELAKRYGDESSPKLLNAIGHKMMK